MSMCIGRTLPPALSPIGLRSIANGILAMLRGDLATSTFTKQLKEHYNVKHCFLLSSGKASLVLILQALKELYPEKDEVLIPAFTCYSVPAAIVRASLKIRICDIEPETLDFDYHELAKQLSSPRLLCVIPTHLFGVTADIPRVREMVGKRSITIIEDAAQAMGGEYKGKKVGTLGDVGFFSLERGKAFSTVQGGIILTNSDEFGNILHRQSEATPAYRLTEQFVLAIYAMALSLFSRPHLFWIPKSLPFLGLGETPFDPDFSIKRMSAFQAGLAAGWQDCLVEFKRTRINNADYYLKTGVKAVGRKDVVLSGLVRYPVMAANASKKKAVLRESSIAGLGGADVYPTTVDAITQLQGCIIDGTSVKARLIVERVVTFPVHPHVTQTDMDKLVDLIADPAEGIFQKMGERSQ